MYTDDELKTTNCSYDKLLRELIVVDELLTATCCQLKIYQTKFQNYSKYVNKLEEIVLKCF